MAAGFGAQALGIQTWEQTEGAHKRSSSVDTHSLSPGAHRAAEKGRKGLWICGKTQRSSFSAVHIHVVGARGVGWEGVAAITQGRLGPGRLSTFLR